MKVIILATEVGLRLRPLTNTKPKGMIRVNGVPIVEYQIRAYLKAGISQSDIIIVVGYKANFIDDYLNKNYPKIKIITNKNYDTMNNMFSLNLALSLIDNGSIMLSNVDYVYESKIIKDFIQCNLNNSVACDKDSYTEESMKIVVKNNKILNISKQITKEYAYGNSIGLYKIDSSNINKLIKIIKSMIKEDKNLELESVLDKLFESIDFYPFDMGGKKWIEINNYDNLYDAEIKFSDFSIESKKALVLDLDGTVYLGNKPITNTIDFINKNNKKYDFYFMTNNTSRNLSDYVDKLNKFRINTSIEKIISPIIPLVAYLKEYNIKNVYVVGNKSFQEYLKVKIPDITYTPDKNICEAVIVAYDTELTYEKLKNASLLLHNNNIKLLATHKDMVCPTEYGDIPDVGSFLKLLEITTLRKPNIVFGKPNSILLTSVLKKYNKNKIAIVGDRLYTDKILANDAGIDFVLVLSGETKREDIENLNKFPEAIVKDLGDILKFNS